MGLDVPEQVLIQVLAAEEDLGDVDGVSCVDSAVEQDAVDQRLALRCGAYSRLHLQQQLQIGLFAGDGHLDQLVSHGFLSVSLLSAGSRPADHPCWGGFGTSAVQGPSGATATLGAAPAEGVDVL